MASNAPSISIHIECSYKSIWQMYLILCCALWCFKNCVLWVILLKFYLLFTIFMHLNLLFYINSITLRVMSSSFWPWVPPQGGPFGEPLFALAHLWAFQFAIVWFPTCLSFTIVNDTHIISHLSKVCATFKYLTLELNAISFSIQPHKCIVWSLSCLLNDFILLTLFSTPSNGPEVFGYSNGIHHIHFFFH